MVRLNEADWAAVISGLWVSMCISPRIYYSFQYDNLPEGLLVGRVLQASAAERP